MNIPLTGLLGQIAPILKLVGIDPAKMANKMGREQVKQRLIAAAPAVVARLEKDKMTPAAKGDGPEAERQVIRSAMYLLFKAQFSFLPRGANVAADAVRDLYDDKTVALVSPLIDATTATAAMVDTIIAQVIEVMF